jgi:hypothetical protein
LSRAKLQLFDPSFWFVYYIGFPADAPFTLLEKAGISAKDFQKTAAARLIKSLIIILMCMFIAEITSLRGWI